eukprot:m.138364 g.138364  ORF g.138364 m.138364 type:complete len:54 (-) comp29986_c0_seq1:1740-1901(-)
MCVFLGLNSKFEEKNPPIPPLAASPQPPNTRRLVREGIACPSPETKCMDHNCR